MFDLLVIDKPYLIQGAFLCIMGILAGGRTRDTGHGASVGVPLRQTGHVAARRSRSAEGTGADAR